MTRLRHNLWHATMFKVHVQRLQRWINVMTTQCKYSTSIIYLDIISLIIITTTTITCFLLILLGLFIHSYIHVGIHLEIVLTVVETVTANARQLS